MIDIFLDSELKQQLDGNILSEGTTYFLNVEFIKPEIVRNWIKQEQISKHIINYHPRFFILELRFENVVGYVNILGVEFDIRSEKLCDGLNGKEQFKALLDDIIFISSKLTFSFKGVTHGIRKSEKTYNFNDLETFDYYYQFVFSYPNNCNLTAILNQCLKHPNSSSYTLTEKVSINRSKIIPQNFFSQLSQVSNFTKISENHPLSKSSFASKTYGKFGKMVMPNEVLNTISKTTYNTKENQFLKFFLEEINNLCLRVLFTIKDIDINDKAKRLRTEIIKLLQNPFFKPISLLTFLPGSSSVLTKKAGYREIYYHFIQSKLSFRPLLDEQKKILHNSKLKNIATLYEIWVFFKIASSLFGNEAVKETFNGRTLENGSLIEAYTWEGEQFSLYFNKTFRKSNNDSYSVNLRPDVSLQIANKNLFLFDAKYKFNTINDQDEEKDLLVRVVKHEDIHKMHAYLDAIPNARTSIVIYPGTKSVFYDRTGITYYDGFELLNANGVGAIPLIPKQKTDMLDTLLKNLCKIF